MFARRSLESLATDLTDMSSGNSAVDEIFGSCPIEARSYRPKEQFSEGQPDLCDGLFFVARVEPIWILTAIFLSGRTRRRAFE